MSFMWYPNLDLDISDISTDDITWLPKFARRSGYPCVSPSRLCLAQVLQQLPAGVCKRATGSQAKTFSFSHVVSEGHIPNLVRQSNSRRVCLLYCTCALSPIKLANSFTLSPHHSRNSHLHNICYFSTYITWLLKRNWKHSLPLSIGISATRAKTKMQKPTSTNGAEISKL